MAEEVRARAVITGRVQGVFFRMETKQTADRHGVSGWVKNRADGAVEAVFEGDKDAVGKVLDWCRQGPPMAKVSDVNTHWEAYSGEFDRFEVRY